MKIYKSLALQAIGQIFFVLTCYGMEALQASLDILAKKIEDEEKLAPWKLLNLSPENKQYALHKACEQGDQKIVELLIQQGYGVNDLNAEKQTPLHRATEKGHSNIVLLLLSHNADIEAKDLAGNTPIFKAILTASKPLVELFITKKANVQVTNYTGETVLHCVVKVANKEIAELLMNNGANLDSAASDGRYRYPWERARVQYGTEHPFVVFLDGKRTEMIFGFKA
jgi:ankyrin repeat protein